MSGAFWGNAFTLDPQIFQILHLADEMAQRRARPLSAARPSR